MKPVQSSLLYSHQTKMMAATWKSKTTCHFQPATLLAATNHFTFHCSYATVYLKQYNIEYHCYVKLFLPAIVSTAK